MRVNLIATLLFGILHSMQGLEYIRPRRSIFGSLLGKTSKKYESTTQSHWYNPGEKYNPGTDVSLHQTNDTTSHTGIEGPENDGCKTMGSGEFCYFPYTYQGVTYYTCIEDAYARHWCVTTKDGSVLSREYCQDSCLNYDCDADVQGVGAIINSPNHPQNYPNRKNCAYTIMLKEKQRVALKFLDFSVEGNGLNNWLVFTHLRHDVNICKITYIMGLYRNQI